jgi:hypothetical protein
LGLAARDMETGTKSANDNEVKTEIEIFYRCQAVKTLGPKVKIFGWSSDIFYIAYGAKTQKQPKKLDIKKSKPKQYLTCPDRVLLLG